MTTDVSAKRPNIFSVISVANVALALVFLGAAIFGIFNDKVVYTVAASVWLAISIFGVVGLVYGW
jgi:hypothetical protein